MAKSNGKAKANKGAVEVRAVRFEPDVVRVAVTDLRRTENVTRPEGVKIDRAMAVLEASIGLVGQTDPVHVARDEDGGFTLVAGNRRATAIERLFKRGAHDGITLCKVLVDGSPAGRVLANLVENEQPGRLDITWLGRAAGYEALAAQGMSVREVAESVGRAEDVVRDVLRIASSDPRCRAALESDASGEAVRVVAPTYRQATDGTWSAVTDKDGNVKSTEVEQPALAWGVVRLIMRKKDHGEQVDLLRKCAGLSVAKATAIINGTSKPATPAPEGEEGEEGEGEGGTGRVEGDDGTDALRAMAADTMIPLIMGLVQSHAETAEALADDDTDAALVATKALGKSIAALQKALVAVAGQAHVARVVSSLKS